MVWLPPLKNKSSGFLTGERNHKKKKKRGPKAKKKKPGSKAPPRQEKSLNMKNKKINAVHVWKQLEDLAVPRLHLSVFDRAVYSHLLRHSRLEGKPQLRFSILWLARGAGLSWGAARKAVPRLVAEGALRLAERSRAGHMVAVRLPEEIRSLGAGIVAACAAKCLPSVGRLPGVGCLVSAGNLEKVDFLETRALRQAIHE